MEGRRQELDKKEILKGQKLNKKSLRTGEIKSLIEYYLYVDEDTYENHMKRFSEIYEYDENLKEFKSDKGRYKFEKEWHGLFLVLFSNLTKNIRFNRDGNKQIFTIDNVKEYNDGLIEAIEEYLPEDQKKYIKEHPIYKLTEAEQEMYKKIENNLHLLFRNASQMPALQRFQNMVSINDHLENALLDIISRNTSTILETNIDMSTGKIAENAANYQYLLDSLEELIDTHLKVQLMNKGKFENEELTAAITNISAISELIKDEDQLELFKKEIHRKMTLGELKLEVPENNPFMTEKIVEQNEKTNKEIQDILEEKSNKEVLEKVYGVLDENAKNAKEKSLKKVIEKMMVFMSLTNEDILSKSKKVRNIMNMEMYNNTLDRVISGEKNK